MLHAKFIVMICKLDDLYIGICTRLFKDGEMLEVSFLFTNVVYSFSAINLCFVINALNNKTIIMLNLSKYC